MKIVLTNISVSWAWKIDVSKWILSQITIHLVLREDTVNNCIYSLTILKR